MGLGFRVEARKKEKEREREGMGPMIDRCRHGDARTWQLKHVHWPEAVFEIFPRRPSNP